MYTTAMHANYRDWKEQVGYNTNICMHLVILPYEGNVSDTYKIKCPHEIRFSVSDPKSTIGHHFQLI